MELFWIIYLIGAIGAINEIIPVVTTISGLVAALSIMVLIIESEGSESYNGAKKTYPISVKILLASAVLFILTPSESITYKMLAAYGVTEAYTAAQESDKVQAIAGKSLKVLEKAMDSYLDEEVK